MKVLIAPQEFKGTLTAAQAGAAMQRAFASIHPEAEIEVVPIADGGSGTVDALLSAADGSEVHTQVTGPIGRPVRARWALIDAGQTAVLEMASASGLTLVAKAERSPLTAHTYGTGELIRAALDAHATRILVGAGGSATCDGGVGAASALGVGFFDEQGRHLPLGPSHLPRLARIDRTSLDPRLAHVKLEVLTDVRNALLGDEGAARVYGPQKGADPDMVDQLEDALAHLARIARAGSAESPEAEAGAGAAGGLAFGLRTFCGATLRRGFDAVSEALGLFAKVNEADLVLTGEGQLDTQTAYFKGPYALGRLAKMQKKRVVLFAGSVLGGTGGVRDAFDEVVTVGRGKVDATQAGQALEDAVGRWALRQSK